VSFGSHAPFPCPGNHLADKRPQRYRDDDYKGKGEPSFSYDEKVRGKQHATSHGGTICYEMQPTSSSRDYGYDGRGDKGKEGMTHVVRQRSVSNGAQLLPGTDDAVAGSSGLQRSNTTGKSLTQSLKRRFGSLRKKRATDEAGY
jgi:hypothetical protein